MPEENDNQIQLSDTGGRLGKRSDLARRGMNAFNYVTGLSTREKPDLQQVSTKTEVSFAFLREWGTKGSGDGQFDFPVCLALDGADNVYVTDLLNRQVQVFDNRGRFLRKWGTEGDEDGQFFWPHSLAL